ncbi:MAG: sulfatase [Clostridia bacterium]|nr:sulfatase [Clostridia bacterium]
MNFIYVHTHDSGREMQPYGAAANNPGLMRLARESFMFRNAHCAAPTCSPSRAAMLSGMTAHESGMLGLAHRGFKMNDYSRHLAPYLSRNGYHTALIGVQHEARKGALIGYDEDMSDHVAKGKPAEYSDEKSLGLACDFLRRRKSEQKPFFLSFGLRSTHRVYADTDHDIDDFVRPPFPIVDTTETRHDYANYLRTLETADKCVAGLLGELDALGLREDTAVMFTTDHGLALPGMKSTLYDTGTGVALMISLPGKAHGCTDALVSHIDVFPTVCDILGVPRPAWIQGKSLLPIMNGEVDEINDYVFSEITYHATYEPTRCVRSKTAKLIRYFDTDLSPRFPNIDRSSAKDAYLTSRLPHKGHIREQLYDLVADPCERINLVNDPGYADVYAELSAVLEAHMKETDDPLLYGQVALADGWVMNRTFDLDPDDPTYNNKGEQARAFKKTPTADTPKS